MVTWPSDSVKGFQCTSWGWECQQNMQGVLLQKMIERYELNAVSQGISASGHGYIDFFAMEI